MRIRLPADASEALSRLAVAERRDARDEAVVLLIDVLRERGLLRDENEPDREPRDAA